MGCVTLNENINNAILDFLENKSGVSLNQDSFDYNPKSSYSPATLINQWYEDRFPNVLPQPDAPFITEYIDNYRDLCKNKMPDRKDYYKMMFDSEGSGKQLLMDHQGQAYYNNYTTTYDLCYNHLAKGLCGPLPRKYTKGKYLPETDLSLIYGNLTQWGVREKKIPKPEPLCKPNPPMAEYQTEYVAHNRTEVKKLNDFPYRGRKKTDL